MSDTTPPLWETALGALWKLWPGIAGALIALRWQPAEATRVDRAVSAVSGFLAAIYVAPLIVEVASVSSYRIEAGIVFLTGLFSMVVVGELMLAVKSLALGQIVGDWLRSILRINRRDGR